MNPFYFLIKWLLFIPFKLLYPVQIINKKNMPKDKKLITVSNHLSGLDIVFVAVNFGGYRRFLAKKEIGKNPIIRVLATWLGVIFIDRDKADRQAMRTIIDSLNKNKSIAIFPEGTRNKTNTDLQEIKGGVSMFSIKTDSKITPVLIARKAKIFTKNYIYVGESFDLKQYSGKPINTAVLEESSKIVSDNMHKAKAEMESFISQKELKKKRKQVKA